MTTTSLQHGLRTAYRDVSMPDDLAAVVGRGRRIRRGRRARRTGVLAAALAAVVGGAGLAVDLPGSHVPAAYADWTPQPRPLTAVERGAVLEICAPPVDGTPPPLRVLDVRGSHGYAFYEGGGTAVLCAVTGSGADWTVGELDVASTAPAAPTPAGTVTRSAVSSGTDQAGWTSTAVYGRAGSGISFVTVTAGDRTFRASVANGTYLAWWPHQVDSGMAVAVRGYDSAGAPVAAAE